MSRFSLSSHIRSILRVHEVLLCLILALSLPGYEHPGIASIWLRAATAAALLTLCIILRYEGIGPSTISPPVAMTLAAAAVFAVYVSWQSGTAHDHAASQFLIRGALFVAFYMALSPLAQRPAAVKRLVLFAAFLGMVQALCGIAYRFTSTWDLAGMGAGNMLPGSFGFFYYENTYGAFAAILMPLAAGLFAYRLIGLARNRAGRAVRLGTMLRNIFDSGVLFLFFAVLVMGAALISANARGSLLIIIAVYSAAAVFFLPWRGKAAFILLALLSLALFVYFGGDKLQANVASGLEWEKLLQDTETRLNIARMNLKLFMDKHWIGWGFGNYKYVSPHYLAAAQFVDGNALNVWRHSQHAHGSFMDLLVEGGVIGFVLGGLILGITPIYVWLNNIKDRSIFRGLMKSQVIIALIAFLPMLLVDSHLRSTAVSMFLIFQMTVFASTGVPHHEDENGERPAGAGRCYPALLRIVVWGLIGICLIATVYDFNQAYLKRSFIKSKMPREQIVEKIINLDASDSDMWSVASDVYYVRAYELTDDSAKAEYLLKAENAAQRATELVPDFGEYWYKLSVMRQARGNIEGAIESIKKAIQLSPPNLKYKTDLMLIYVFEAQKNPSMIQRNQWNGEARKIYNELKALPNYPAGGMRTVRLYNNYPMTSEQKKYLADFAALADKYEAELTTGRK